MQMDKTHLCVANVIWKGTEDDRPLQDLHLRVNIINDHHLDEVDYITSDDSALFCHSFCLCYKFCMLRRARDFTVPQMVLEYKNLKMISLLYLLHCEAVGAWMLNCIALTNLFDFDKNEMCSRYG